MTMQNALSLVVLSGPKPSVKKPKVPVVPPLPERNISCQFGQPIHPEVYATEGQPRIVAGVHVSPHNTSGEYLLPYSSCGDNTTGPDRRPCVDCITQHSRRQQTIRGRLAGPELESIESHLGRRMTHAEAVMVLTEMNHYGFYNEGLTLAQYWERKYRREHNPAQSRSEAALATWESCRKTEKSYAHKDAMLRSSRSRFATFFRAVSGHAWMPSFHETVPPFAGDAGPTDADSATVLTRSTVRRRDFQNEAGEMPCGHYYNDECDCSSDEWPLPAPRMNTSPQHGLPFVGSRADGSQRLVGIEVEYNRKTDLTAWVSKWRGNVHTDGSCGYEAVTTPISGKHIEACLTEMTAILKKKKSGYDTKCGVHVHVDARDITWPAMFRLLKVYSLVEPLLYLIGGQNRLNGRYCSEAGKNYRKALANLNDKKAAVLEEAFRGSADPYHRGMGGFADHNLTSRHYMRARPGKKDNGRYRGINIVPWLVGRRSHAPDTTIEFRMHRNSLDGARIAQWATLLTALVDYANTATDTEVDGLPRSSLRALCQIAPKQKAWILARIKAWRAATTPESEAAYLESGEPRPIRRISVAKGEWLCAV